MIFETDLLGVVLAKVIGRMPPRGQEMCDHYMAPPSLASAALECMKEIQEQCFKLGIPLRTRHREVWVCVDGWMGGIGLGCDFSSSQGWVGSAWCNNGCAGC